LRLERLGVPSSKVAERSAWEERSLNAKLLEGDDTGGVFGARAGWALKRLPSAAYWGGLGSWGIRLFPGHMDAYFRSLDGFYRRVRAAKDMPRDPEAAPATPANWHPHIPEPPSEFPGRASVALRRQDAEYLRDRIQARHAGTLLGVLSSRAKEGDLDATWPWEHAHLRDVAPALGDQLKHAKLFSVCLHGAALLYNLMLAELRAGRGGSRQAEDEERIETYTSQLTIWAEDVDALRLDIEAWDLTGVWCIARNQGRSLGFPTRAFVRRWVEGLGKDGPRATFADGSDSRTLIRDREIQIKRGRARLASPRHLELWGGESGIDRMDFRWTRTKVLLRDIFDGLARSEGDAGNA